MGQLSPCHCLLSRKTETPLEDEAAELLNEHAADAVSHFDFEVTHKKKTATLTVTKETLKIFQNGKLMETYPIKSLKSWSVGGDKIVFKTTSGGEIPIGKCMHAVIRSHIVMECGEKRPCPAQLFRG